ncbi:MAG: metal ABC transporter permease [Chloroflexi bacterium]|nr:MAG: metal ABC transporter permease [Chloroflexota bacterium]
MTPPALDTLSGVPWSWNPVDDLNQLFTFEFMRNAYLAGTAAALVAGVVGYFVVLRGLSFAGHSLSLMGFTGATGALVVGVHPLVGLFAVDGAGALLIGALARRSRGRDVAVGVVVTGTLGLGLLFLRLYRAGEALPVLVGDILGIDTTEVAITAVAATLIVALVAVAFRPLLFSSLDEEVAEARGVRTGAMSLLLLLILAATTAIATPIVGVLLTFSLLIAPAATASLLSSRPPVAVTLAIALGVLYLWIGLAVSYWVDLPPSIFVTALAFAGYAGARLRGL